VKAALKTALQARVDLSGVTIEYGPASTWLDDDLIILGGARGTFNVARMIGSGDHNWLDEEYILTVSIYAYRGVIDDTVDIQANEERAYALAASVVAQVCSDPSIGERVTQANPVSFELVEEWDEEHLGVHHRYDLGIQVTATP
jgi:hypothetical protein